MELEFLFALFVVSGDPEPMSGAQDLDRVPIAIRPGGGIPIKIPENLSG
jgi:hypothetical protein